MSGSFDPYYKWLGISPKDQPPNHYRLLAIDLFESDPDVISSAADQRMTHVRAFHTGRHSALSQQILNEIAAARVCLLNSEKKAAYDHRLHEQLGLDRRQTELSEVPIQPLPQPPVLPPLPPATPPLDEPVDPRFEGVLPRPLLRRRSLVWQALTAVLVAAVLFLAILIAMTTRGGPGQVGQTGPQPPIVVPGPSEPPSPFLGRGKSTGREDLPSTPPEKTAEDQNAPPKETISPPQGPGQSEPPETDPTEPPETGEMPIARVVGLVDELAVEPPEATPQKAPVPDAAAQAAAEGRLQAELANASAAELLEAARADRRPADERFVLLKAARDLAASAEDIETALGATDQIVGLYEIDPLEIKAETFNKLSESAKSPSAARTVAEHGLALVNQAVAEGKDALARDIAETTLRLARNSDDTGLATQVTLRWLEIQKSP